MITKYGLDVVFVVVAIVAVGLFVSWKFIEIRWLQFGLILLFVNLLLFTLYFFRDPSRVAPQGENLVITPGDGKVVLIQDVREDEYLNSDAIQVSVFLSPLDVHVNRYPITGVVGYYKYIEGEYLVAFDDKSSHRNERTHIGIESPHGKILFKQIAGFVARRIVANVKVGDQSVAGERFGMIKFGSRVDVIVPKGTKINVKIGDRVVAGETVLATLN